MLDTTLAEVMPEGPGRAGLRRRALADQPGVSADDPYMHPDKSELLQSLNALIDAAAARAGVLNSDDDDPLAVMARAAGLSRAEFETVALHAEGWAWPTIAKAQGVSEAAAKQAGYRGSELLRQFVLNSSRYEI